MPVGETGAQSFERLRILAAQDPRAARALFWELLDSNSPDLDTILQGAGRPGEGRLRQLIANAVRTRPDKERLTPTFVRWLQNETDEFARRAIEAVLANVDMAAHQIAPQTTIFDPAFVGAYRYTASRLKHEIRNALLDPRAEILRLKDRISAVTDEALRADLTAMVGQIDDAFQRFGRTVDFDPDDEHFRFRDIDFRSWIQTMNIEYGQRYRRIDLSWNPEPPGYPIIVRASDYLLRLAFWNQWINAQQAAPDNCQITIHHRRLLKEAEMTIIDSGPGFPESLKDVAFRVQYSRAGNGQRGRGLLEVQDAVEQLQGSVQLVMVAPNEHRVRIRIPLSEA